jgi:hypothetical protein
MASPGGARYVLGHVSLLQAQRYMPKNIPSIAWLPLYNKHDKHALALSLW